MKANDKQITNTLDQCKFLWEEYKYRHDLIWQRIFSFTTAVVLISIIPYIRQDIACILDNWVLIAPILAFLMVCFISLIMQNELNLFGRVKEAYRRTQNTLLGTD